MSASANVMVYKCGASGVTKRYKDHKGVENFGLSVERKIMQAELIKKCMSNSLHISTHLAKPVTSWLSICEK